VPATEVSQRQEFHRHFAGTASFYELNGITEMSVTSTMTRIIGACPVAAINEPDTGGTNSGCRLTAKAMWLLPTTSPVVESKPFQPAPGR